jgi:hypothetical protein
LLSIISRFELPSLPRGEAEKVNEAFDDARARGTPRMLTCSHFGIAVPFTHKACFQEVPFELKAPALRVGD